MPGLGRGGMLPGDGGRGPPRPGSPPRGALGRGPPGRGPPWPGPAWPGAPWAGPWAGGGPGRGAAGRGGAPEPTPNGLLPTRGVRGPGRGPLVLGGTTALPASAAAAAGRCWAGAGAAGPGRGPWAGRGFAGGADGASAAGRCWTGAGAGAGAGAGVGVGAGVGAAGPGRGPGRGPGPAGRGRSVVDGACAAAGVDCAPGCCCGRGPGAGAPEGVPGRDGTAVGRGPPPGRGRLPPPGRPLPEPPESPPDMDSRSLRATGASIVDDGDFTYSPRSCNLLRTCLLLTPSSLASSCTRALPATALPESRRPAADPLDLEPRVEARSWCDLHDWLMTGRPCFLVCRTRESPGPRSRHRCGLGPARCPAVPGRATPAGTPSAARHDPGTPARGAARHPGRGAADAGRG
jgi:hypothetical protein